MRTLLVSLTSYEPASPPRAIVVILHGMMEHNQPYRSFASFLKSQGLLVLTYDQLGHGKRPDTIQDLGKVPPDSWSKFVSEACTIVKSVHDTHPNIPIFLIGHSFGSFVAQAAAAQLGDIVSGLILLGSAYQPRILSQIGLQLSQIMGWNWGWKSPADLIHFCTFAPFRWQVNGPSEFSWLSRNAEFVTHYEEGPLFGFTPSFGFYSTLFTGLLDITRTGFFKTFPKHLRILILSGTNDPLSKGGKTVQTLANKYRSAGATSSSVKLYPDARHVLLHELNKDEVMNDILGFINKESNS